MRSVILIVLIAGLTGCGPLFSPMLPRLAPEQQQQVDQIWDNLLTPPQRADRQTLLDVNVAYWLYTVGVDRMHMTSEKYFAGGVAVMEIDCDRANPDSDQFTITVLDQRGRTLRRERYSRAEVEESSKMVGLTPFGDAADRGSKLEIQITAANEEATTRAVTRPATQPATTRALTPEERRLLEEIERRRSAVMAATQPARVNPIRKN